MGVPRDDSTEPPAAPGDGRAGRAARDLADLVRRGEELLDEAGRRSRADALSRWARLRVAAPLVAQSAVAAGAAWWLAGLLADDDRVPFFAPIAAVISLGSALGLRLKRTAELVLGVALGIGIGDSLLHVIGHGTWQLVLVVALAMTAAVLVDGGQIIVLQAATSSVLVATLVPPEGAVGGLDRFADALLGGAVGMAVGLLLFPLNPVTVARRHLEPVVRELAGVLEDVAAALEAGDAEAASTALSRARATEPLVAALNDAVVACAEIARVAPARWASRSRTGAYADAAPLLDYAARNVRVLVRRAIVVLRGGTAVPAELPLGIRALGAAVREVGAAFGRDEEPRAARTLLLEAASLATQARTEGLPLSAEVVVAQARSVVLDLLVATGVTRADAGDLLALADTPSESGRPRTP